MLFRNLPGKMDRRKPKVPFDLQDLAIVRSQSIGVDRCSALVVLFQPPVSKVFREPARGLFSCHSAVLGRVEDGNAKFRLDGIERSTDRIGMRLGHEILVIHVRGLHVLLHRLDNDRLPAVSRQSFTGADKACATCHGAADGVGQGLALKRQDICRLLSQFINCDRDNC